MKDAYIVTTERYDKEQVCDGKMNHSERSGQTWFDTCTYSAQYGDTIRLYRLELVEERKIGMTVKP